jgi:hypothetical protein
MFPNGRYKIYCQVLQYIQGKKHLFNRRNASIELTHRPPENLELTNGYGTMAQQNASYLSCMRCNIGTCICICKRIKIFTIVPSLCDFTILNLVSSKGQRPALVLIEKNGVWELNSIRLECRGKKELVATKWSPIVALIRVARFFLTQYTKTGENIPIATYIIDKCP